MKNLLANSLTRAAMAGVAVWLASIFVAHGQNKPDDLKQRILSQAQSAGADDYAFTRTIRSEANVNGKNETTILIDKYDPTKNGDARWSLVSVNGSTPPADALSNYRKETAKRRVPGYHRLATYFTAPVTTTTDLRGRTVFRFASLPKDSVLVFSSDLSRNTTAEASVSENNGVPFVDQVKLSIQPTRIKLIMKLDYYQSTSRFRMGPDGKPVLIEQVADVNGSGMGKEGRLHQVITYSDYRLVAR
ncbi:MAG TPA: hypothetical protein VM940_01660 [Chthoniobacterales bacterium]|nr:hypothetical protein [Chthoniobacterales bacterium]